MDFSMLANGLNSSHDLAFGRCKWLLQANKEIEKVARTAVTTDERIKSAIFDQN